LRAGAFTLSGAAVLAALFVLAWRLAFPFTLPGFRVGASLHNHLGQKIRVAEVLAVIALVSFVLASPSARFPRWRSPLGVFVVFALALTGLAGASSLWAVKPALAVVQGMHMLIWVAFALVVAKIRLPPERMAAAFVLGLLVHATVGFAQVIIQNHVGLSVLGELRIPPGDPGKYVIAGASWFLRAYGLSQHPNVLAGHLAVGLILCWGLAASRRSVGRGLVSLTWATLFASLLLTFSRSGWLAALFGMTVALMWLGRLGRLSRRTVGFICKLTVITAVLVAVFAYTFDLFLVPRIVDALQGRDPRPSWMNSALKIIAAHPLAGVGAGNFSEVTRHDAVHNVLLLIGAELGLAGLTVVGIMVMILVAVGSRRWRARSAHQWDGLVVGSLTALVTVSLFDHYLWTHPQGALLGAWLVGWQLTDHPEDGVNQRQGS
jgi:O-Antigen ligase